MDSTIYNRTLRKDGRPFVLDFGIAREIQETMTRVTGKSSSGTLMYMSPEQLKGELPKKEQDIYSFAAMVYECLKGEPPFVRGQIEYQIVNNPPPPLPQGTASWLSATTMRGLAKKANERPTTCCEILGVLSCGMIVADDIKLQTQIAIKAYQEEDYEKAFASAQRADTNDAEIQYIMGYCYRFGEGVDEDWDTAMRWYRKAAEQGHVRALFDWSASYRLRQNDCYNMDQTDLEGLDLEGFEKCFLMTLRSDNPKIRHMFDRMYVDRDRYCEELNVILAKANEKQSLELIRSSADSGYGYAQYELGCRYEMGNGVPQDYAEAVEWYRKAAEQDCRSYSPGPLEKLGEMYKRGLGVTKDYDEAIKWYRKAVEVWDSPQNKYLLGNMYDVAKKYSEAAEWYRKAAERGHSDAQCRLGDLYGYGLIEREKSVMERVKESIKWYRMSAEQDNAKAQYELAHSLIFLDDVCNVSKDALTWLRKSGEQGYSAAQHELGARYANPHKGDYVTKDIAESTRWYKLAEQSYRKAAERGDVSAQCNLGLMFYKGEGVIQDFKEAFKWLNKAAVRGNRSSQYYLGNCFSRAQGVSQDYVEAVKWYRKTAERGDTEAQYKLGYMYKKGLGVAQDYKVALDWFLKAAGQHNQDACYELGCMYKTGLGVEQDYVKAMMWYQKAISHSGAVYNLGLMYEKGYGVKADCNEARKHYTLAAVGGNADAQYQVGIMYFCGKSVKRDQSKALDWMRKAAEQGHVKAQQCLGEWYANWCDTDSLTQHEIM